MAAFTYTKVRNYETCGLRFQATDILKLPGMEAAGDAIDYGNRVHKAFKDVLKDGQQLSVQLRHLQNWVDYVNDLAAQPDGTKHIEEKWALDSDYNPTDYYGRPWMRYNCDAAVTAYKGTVGWLIDWKTGKRVEDNLQLWMGAAMMFRQFPTLQQVDSMFVWLKEDDGQKKWWTCISPQTIKKEEINDTWDQMLPRIQAFNEAVANGGPFYPNPGQHCYFCRHPECEFRKAGKK